MNESEEAKALWAPVYLGLAVGGEHGVEFQGRGGNHARLSGRKWSLQSLLPIVCLGRNWRG